MERWEGGTPETTEELFRFYQRYVKLLYAAVQVENELPMEALLEYHAAFDHVVRISTLGEDEAAACAKAFSHLKRSCLDIFKLRVKASTDQYRELKSIDLSLIDNGAFVENLHRLRGEIKEKATEARRLEATTDREEAIPAFAPWEEVFLLCERFERDFFLSPHLNWAEARTRLASVEAFVRALAALCLLQVIFRTINGSPGPGLTLIVATVAFVAASVAWGWFGSGWARAPGRWLWQIAQRVRHHLIRAWRLRERRASKARARAGAAAPAASPPAEAKP